jgi:hypothetical protein
MRFENIVSHADAKCGAYTQKIYSEHRTGKTELSYFPAHKKRETVQQHSKMQKIKSTTTSHTDTKEDKPMVRRRSSSTMKRKESLSKRSSLTDKDSKVNFILSTLTAEEVETAARACYEYVQNPNKSDRNEYARRIIQRYLEAKKGKVDVATQEVKATLKFRRDINVKGLMNAFDRDKSTNDCTEPLQKHLSCKKLYVQGYDKQGRSTLFFIPRLVEGHDAEWTLKEAVYSIERAIACSKTEDHTINAVIDFSGFSVYRHSPPVDIGKQFLTTLRSHYAGQIHGIFLLDTPSAFSILWKIFQPFVGTATRSKIHFLSGARRKQQHLTDLYDLDQVPSWMIPGGTRNRSLDLEEYFFERRFNEAFDEDNTR